MNDEHLQFREGCSDALVDLKPENGAAVAMRVLDGTLQMQLGGAAATFVDVVAGIPEGAHVFVSMPNSSCWLSDVSFEGEFFVCWFNTNF